MSGHEEIETILRSEHATPLKSQFLRELLGIG